MALAPVDVSKNLFQGIIYGAPGTGKSRFACAYPKEWGTAAYIAIDNDARKLTSVLPQHRDKLEVLGFEGDDPIQNLNEIAVHNWKKDGHGVLIVDTLSRATKRMLVYAAKVGLFPAKDRIMFGPKSAEISQGLPVPGDYGGAQHLVMNWVDTLLSHQRDMHLILVCHEDLYIPGNDAPAAVAALGAIGGPATVGNAILRDFPSEFPVVVRLEVKSKTALDGVVSTKYNAITSMKGVYTARIKEAEEKGNPMPSRELAVNPESWWAEFTEKFMKGGSDGEVA